MKRTAAERQAFVEGAAARMVVEPTNAEMEMWAILQFQGFRKQWVATGKTKNGGHWYYVMDFYHPELKLCIEVDGGIHKRQRGRDRRRDTRLAGEGIATIRFTNNQVLRHRNEVVVAILDAGVRHFDS